MIRGSYSRLTTGGPMAYWEWSWLGIDFIREAGSGRSGTSAICGRSTAPAAIPMWEEHAYAPRPEFAAAAELKDAEPNVATPLRDTYPPTGPLRRRRRCRCPMTFAETFSYGLEQ